MPSEREDTAEIRVGLSYWAPWVLLVVGILLLRSRIGVPGAPALLPSRADISLAVDGQGHVWVATMESPDLVPLVGERAELRSNPCIWRIDRWNRLRREVGGPRGGRAPNGAPALEARLRYPWLLGFDSRCRRHFTDPTGALYLVDDAGVVRRLAAGARGGWWAAVAPDGSAYLVSRFQVLRRMPDGREKIVEGTGVGGHSGDGGPARCARIGRVSGLAVRADGSVFLADAAGHCVRCVDPGGTILTVAGTGRRGYGGDGGSAAAATLNHPMAIGADGYGSIWLHDRGNNRVRRIDRDGTIVTAAGCGRAFYSGNGGPARQATIHWAQDLRAGPRCEVFFVDLALLGSGPCVRQVDARGLVRAVAIQGMGR